MSPHSWPRVPRTTTRFAGFGTASGPFAALTVSLGPPPPPPPPPTGGPDIIVGELTDVAYYGRVGDIVAYSTSEPTGATPATPAIPWQRSVRAASLGHAFLRPTREPSICCAGAGLPLQLPVHSQRGYRDMPRGHDRPV